MASVGIDIVENQRIGKLMSDSFVKKFLNDDELEDFRNIGTEDRKVEFLAGRIAAKEAVLKCLKTPNICSLRDITIRNDGLGAPYAEYEGREIQISISHEKLFSVAVAMFLR